MRIDGTNIVPGTTASQEKRRQDGRGKSVFSLTSEKSATISDNSSITPPLDIDDVEAVWSMQTTLHDSTGDIDQDTVRASELLLDQLSRFQEDILNRRELHTPLLIQHIASLRSTAAQASDPIRKTAAAVITRAEILLYQHAKDTST